MVLLDSNLFIYASKGQLNRAQFEGERLAYASITKIEALGYNGLNIAHALVLENLFASCAQLAFDERVIEQAIKLKQQSTLKLADAVIAATALVHNIELWTNDRRDFKNIYGLKLRTPT